MPLTQVFFDNFNRANTSPGSGANSTTGIGNNWVDSQGNLWQISGNKATTNPSVGVVGSDIVALYWTGSGGLIQNGAINCINTNDVILTARYNPTDGSGYSCIFFKEYGVIQFKKAVSNDITRNLSGNGNSGPAWPIATYPSGVPVLEFTAIDSGPNVVLTLNAYDSLDLTTVLATASYTDNSATLQQAGYWGIGNYNTVSADNATISFYTAGPPIAGSVTAGTVTKTKAAITAATPTGGVGTLATQWQRSTSAISGFSNVTGATALTLGDTGLNTNTSYWYRQIVTDSSAPTPQTAAGSAIQITTLLSTAKIIGNAGDSITFGYEAPPNGSAAQKEVQDLIAAGYSATNSNYGVGGSASGQWISGATFLNSAISQWQYDEATDVSMMIGTNDLGPTPTTNSAYLSNVASFCAAVLAAGFSRVILNIPIAINSANWLSNGLTVIQENAILAQYATQLGKLDNGTTIRMGDATGLDGTVALGDGTHPSAAGYTTLGKKWATAYENIQNGIKNVTPTTLGAIAWYSASQFSGLSDGTACGSSYTDQTGNGNTGMQATSGLQPIKVTEYDGLPAMKFAGQGAGIGIQLPAGVAVDWQAASVFVVARRGNVLNDAAMGEGSAFCDLGSGQLMMLWEGNPSSGEIYYNTHIIDSTPYIRGTSLIGLYGFCAGASSMQFSFGNYDSPSQSALLSSAGVTGGKIGGANASTAYDFAGTIREVVIFNRQLSAPDLAALKAWAARPSITTQVTVDGCSLDVGYNSTTTTHAPVQNSWPWQANRLSGEGTKFSLLSWGANSYMVGQTAAQCLTNAVANADPLYNAVAFTKNWYAMGMGPSNDIAGGATGAAAYTTAVSLCQGRRTAGYKVIAFTLPARGGFNSTQNGYLATYNTSVRSNWTTFADALADVGADARMQNSANTTYFDTDGTHLTAAGYGVVAGIVVAAITPGGGSLPIGVTGISGNGIIGQVGIT
jgi:lysophospholipase L1-like esterase